MFDATALRSPHTIAGTEIARFTSYTPIYARQDNGFEYLSETKWLMAHDLSSLGVSYASFDLWEWTGAYQSGYFAGEPNYFGAYVYGSPTKDAEAALPAATTWTGLAGALVDTPDGRGLPAWYGTVQASYDPVAQSVTVTLQITNADGVSWSSSPRYPYFNAVVEGDDQVATPDSVGANVVTCTGAVVAGAFSCGTANDPYGSGAISGRLYGPDGSEIAGVFTRYGVVGYDLTWGTLQSGMAGAFAAHVETGATSAARTLRSRRAVMGTSPKPPLRGR